LCWRRWCLGGRRCGCFYGGRLGGWCCRSGACTGSVTDRHQGSADLDRLVLLDEDGLNHARDGRRNLRVDLVGGHFEQRFVNLDAVSNVFEPTGDRAFRDTLSECREADGFAHELLSFKPILII
jgi:hypothetical protein